MIHESCISFMFWLSRKLYFFPQVNTNPYFCFSRGHKIWKKKCKNQNVENTRRHFKNDARRPQMKGRTVLAWYRAKMYNKSPTNEGYMHTKSQLTLLELIHVNKHVEPKPCIRAYRQEHYLNSCSGVLATNTLFRCVMITLRGKSWGLEVKPRTRKK